MKLRHIVILSVILILFGLLFFRINSGEKKDTVVSPASNKVFLPVVEVQNKQRSFLLETYGQINTNHQLDMAFEVSGRLLKADVTLKPGIKFKKGQLIAAVDNSEALFGLSARKSSFITLVVNAMPDIRLDYPSEATKWESFLNKISIDSYLPPLPKPSTKKEELFLNTRNIVAEYNNIRSQELRMEKYFFTAPFDGTLLEVYAEPGAIVNPGTRIATLIKTGDFEVKIPIMLSDLSYFESKGEISIHLPSGEKIGTGKLNRVSDVINKQTQSVDAFFSIQPLPGKRIMNGMYINAKLHKESVTDAMAVPFLSVQDGKVHIIEDSLIRSIPVQIVATVPDTLLVTGLKNGMQVITDRISSYPDSMRIIGIKK
jgi:membrane fusion protein, multidrug efflux system